MKDKITGKNGVLEAFLNIKGTSYKVQTVERVDDEKVVMGWIEIPAKKYEQAYNEPNTASEMLEIISIIEQI